MINVKVKRLHPGAKLPFYATAGSAAMDFEAVEITPCVDSNGAISSMDLPLYFQTPVIT